MESIIEYIECMTPTMLPFECKERGRNKNNYTLFILHYFDYYSKISNDTLNETQLNSFSTSDMVSINETDGASNHGSDSDEIVKDEEHEEQGTYNAARKIWKELDLKYKDIFRKRCIIFNNTPRIGELTTVEDLSYLEVLPSSMISDDLSQSEMLLLHAMAMHNCGLQIL